jgi:hypothetical protein
MGTRDPNVKKVDFDETGFTGETDFVFVRLFRNLQMAHQAGAGFVTQVLQTRSIIYKRVYVMSLYRLYRPTYIRKLNVFK